MLSFSNFRERKKPVSQPAFFVPFLGQIDISSLAHSSLQTIWIKSGKVIFQNEKGLVAYESVGKYRVVAGEPLAFIKGDESEVFRDFVMDSNSQGKKVCGYYFGKEFCDQLKDFESYQAGVSRSLFLEGFDLQGSDSREIRRALNQGRRYSLNFQKLEHDEKQTWLMLLEQKEKQLLKSKKGPRVGFLLTEIKSDYPGAKEEEWYIVNDESNSLQAFVSLHRLGNHQAYIDHLYQFEGAHKFALDYLLAKLILRLKDQEIKEIDFGFNAFQKVVPKDFVSAGLWLNRVFEPVYEAKGLYQYKRKFTNHEEPNFLLLQKNSSKLKQLCALTLATF